MADISPSQIAPLGDAPEHGHENSGRKTPAKPKSSDKPAPEVPAVEAEIEEVHQLDELA